MLICARGDENSSEEEFIFPVYTIIVFLQSRFLNQPDKIKLDYLSR